MDEIPRFERGTIGTCDCGNIGEYTTDPFAEEINGEELWSFMCEDCVHESAMEV
jgi:hypothetical protein